MLHMGHPGGAVRGVKPDVIHAWTTEFDEGRKIYTANVDFPTSLYWKELHQRYQNAKVVLSTRETTKDWAKSFRNL